METAWLRPLAAVILIAALAAPLSGCNTAAGVGQDLSAAGHAVTNGAEKVKNGLSGVSPAERVAPLFDHLGHALGDLRHG
jgi:predicted small secreted protein